MSTSTGRDVDADLVGNGEAFGQKLHFCISCCLAGWLVDDQRCVSHHNGAPHTKFRDDGMSSHIVREGS